MARYLLNIYQPDGPVPDDAVMSGIAQRLNEVNQGLKTAGSWVFTGGLHAPDAATVVRSGGMVTDGPYVESREHIGGFYVIKADDLDDALGWGRRVADATGLPVEVRPFQDTAES